MDMRAADQDFLGGIIIEKCNIEKRNVLVPIWEKYTLTVEEAAEYFRIGENKLRKVISDNPDEEFILYNGNRAQIKRGLFEKYIDKCQVI